MAEEISTDKQSLKDAIGRKLAARVLRKWTEDFVDEGLGEVVTIERNEIILERDVVLDEDNISLITDVDIDMIILQKRKS